MPRWMRTWGICGIVLVQGAVRAEVFAQAVSDPTGAESAIATEPAPVIPVLHFLVIDDRHVPHVRVSWQGADGKPVVIEGDRTYEAPALRSPLGGNLDCFVALGGTRLDKQAGDPDGAIVRIGLYKRDPAKPFFEGLEQDGPIQIELRNVVFDKPAKASPETGVQHVKYSQEALAECGLAGSAFELYNTVSPTDDLRGSVKADNGRLGALGSDGSEFVITQEQDGSYTLRVTFPYSLLRHVKDPWQLTKPGTFLEPLHFHVEFEAVPVTRTSPADAEMISLPAGGGAE